MKLYLSSVIPISRIYRRQKKLFSHLLNRHDQAGGVIQSHIFSKCALYVKTNFMAPIMDGVQQPQPFTTKFAETPCTHFIDLGRVKG